VRDGETRDFGGDFLRIGGGGFDDGAVGLSCADVLDFDALAVVGEAD
jgi:hypothetical protein